MRSRCFVFLLLLSSLALAQTKTPAPTTKPSAPPSASTAPAASASATTVPDTAAVMTLNGVCDPLTAKPKAAAAAKTAPVTVCKTVVTKADFEQLLKAVTPPGAPAMPANRRRDAATQLAQLLTVAAAAEKNGVENTPEGRELLRIARLQALGNAYVRQLQQKSKPTDAEIEAYYSANSEKFQQASVQQLFIPPLKPGAPNPPSTPDEAAQKARAEKFRERAIAGEPFDKLEKEAIEGTAYQNPPQVDVTFQRETLPPARQSVFNLKDGEFSPVMTEPAGAVVYKMISKKTLPLSEVKERISQRLSQEKFQSAMEALTKSSTPVLNDAYFGAPGAAPVTVSPAHPLPAVPAQVPKQPK